MICFLSKKSYVSDYFSFECPTQCDVLSCKSIGIAKILKKSSGRTLLQILSKDKKTVVIVYVCAPTRARFYSYAGFIGWTAEIPHYLGILARNRWIFQWDRASRLPAPGSPSVRLPWRPLPHYRCQSPRIDLPLPYPLPIPSRYSIPGSFRSPCTLPPLGKY